jgi:mannose/fructose/N-acetylgalactosamine-specific phosphotransferase system component IIC
MATRTSFWFEVRHAVWQWAGVVLGAVISGLLLGVLELRGMTEISALEIAGPVGVLFALFSWISIARSFSRRTITQIAVPISSTISTVEGEFTFEYSFQNGDRPNATVYRGPVV